MKDKMSNTLPGLAHQIVSKDIFIVLDIREMKTRYVGLICQVPFGYGYYVCPFVRKGLHFDIPMTIFPKYFRNTNRAWNWVQQHASGWKDRRRYTIFNFLIAWLGIYGQVLYVIFSNTKMHVATTQLLVAPFLAFYPTTNIIATITAKVIAAIVFLFGIINFLVFLHERKAGKAGGNRN